jgi:Family of unknown function (DUF6169)
LLSPYPLRENDEYAYEFTTSRQIKYSIYFIDYGFMFSDYPAIAENIFSFNIEVIDGNETETAVDERIGLTVVEILRLFFEKMNNVAIYVCDSIDKRQQARKRKFDLWFWKYSDGNILKEDGVAMIEEVEILNALLIHKQNPNLLQIILAFKEINERAGDK